MATKIICHAKKCIFWENKICTSEEIIYDLADGCLTYEILENLTDDVQKWDNDIGLLGEDDDDLSWDDDDLYLDDFDAEGSWNT
jgi:hypothetical protein